MREKERAQSTRSLCHHSTDTALLPKAGLTCPWQNHPRNAHITRLVFIYYVNGSFPIHPNYFSFLLLYCKKNYTCFPYRTPLNECLGNTAHSVLQHPLNPSNRSRTGGSTKETQHDQSSPGTSVWRNFVLKVTAKVSAN